MAYERPGGLEQALRGQLVASVVAQRRGRSVFTHRLRRFAVDGAAGADEDEAFDVVLARQPDQPPRAVHVHVVVELRVLHGARDAGLRGAVHDAAEARRLEHGAQVVVVAQVGVVKGHAGRQVRGRAGAEVVEDVHVVALPQQRPRQVRADKTRAAGNQNRVVRSHR